MWSLIIELTKSKKVTLNQLPYYLLHKTHNFENELAKIEESFGVAKGLEAIKLISYYNNLNLCIGRKNIERLLKDRNITSSESEIRRMLKCLSSLGLVSSRVGRKGTEVTSFGKEFIKWAENR